MDAEKSFFDEIKQIEMKQSYLFSIEKILSLVDWESFFGGCGKTSSIIIFLGDDENLYKSEVSLDSTSVY